MTGSAEHAGARWAVPLIELTPVDNGKAKCAPSDPHLQRNDFS
jgi:hypothetical protein